MKKVLKISLKLFFITILLLTTTCKKDELAKVTKLEIGTTSNITENTVMVSAEFVDVSTNISSFGFCWATTSKPKVTDGLTPASIAVKKGEFSISISGLSPNTKYYVRAYAREGEKAIYSSTEISFITNEAKYINITRPLDTDNWTKGSTETITWTDNIDENVHIELYKGETLLEDIIASTESDEIHNWSIKEGLDLGADYSIKISSVDDASIFAQSEAFEISEEPEITITAPISTDNWQRGSTQNITWTDNIDGNVNIELFKNDIIVSTDGDIALNTASTSPKSWTVPACLTAGTDYKIKITSVDDENLSGESEDFTISVIPPTVITQDASNITGTTATLNGTVNANGETVGVSFEWGETTAYGETTTATSVDGATVKTVSADIIGLDPGETYHFLLKADDIEGDDESFTTSTPKPTATTLAASTVTETSAILNGTVNANGYETTVTFEYGTTNTYGNVINFASNPVTGSTETNVSASLSSLLAGETYHYRVKAVNSGGITYGEDEVFTTNAYYIKVEEPTDGDHWVMGETKTIKWKDNIEGNLKIQLLKNGFNPITIKENVDGILTQSDWIIRVDLTPDNDYSIKVSSLDDNISNESIQFIISDKTGTLGTVQDYNKLNTYQTIKLGKQWWMKENLKTGYYSDGTPISESSFHVYNNDPSNKDIYGLLYSRGAITSKLICPVDWHVPSDTEWKNLEIFLHMSESEVSKEGFRGVNEGAELKDGSFWASSDTSMVERIGFSALPGGYSQLTYDLFSRQWVKISKNEGTDAYFWTCSLVLKYVSGGGWIEVPVGRHLNGQSSQIDRVCSNDMGFISIRCIKD